MASVHQQFKASLDVTAYEKGLQRMESTTRTSTARTAREFDKIQASVSRQTRSMGGSGGMRAGQVAMQAQDIAVQMQMGARASTIIAQQGSQILSVFGPHGMLLGGLVASAAMFWEVVRGSKALNKEAKEKAALEKQGRSTAAAKAGLEAMKADQKAIKIAELRGKVSQDEVAAAERRLELEERIARIRGNPDMSPENKAVFEEIARERFRAEEAARNREEKRDRGAARVAGEGQDIIDRADQIRGNAPSKADARREAREQRNAERRAINEEVDAADRKKRNDLQGTGAARTTGLTEAEKEKAREARKGAVDVAKDKKLQAEISQENIDKILNGIDNLITK